MFVRLVASVTHNAIKIAMGGDTDLRNFFANFLAFGGQSGGTQSLRDEELSSRAAQSTFNQPPPSRSAAPQPGPRGGNDD